MDFQQTYFIKSAATVAQCPPDTGIEIAFAGRSNAGKSSLLNTLCQQKKLAKTSKTPGRTQLLNFFSPDPDQQFRLVDLPGYGYAKVAKSMRTAWDNMIDSYLRERQSLQKIVLIMDIRHPLQPFDLHLIDWASQAGLALHMVLTKADKLKFGPAKAALLKTLRAYQHQRHNRITGQLFSALKKTGIDELQAYLLANRSFAL